MNVMAVQPAKQRILFIRYHQLDTVLISLRWWLSLLLGDHMLARPVNEEQHNCGVSCGAETLKTFRPNLIIESTDDPKWRRELAFDFEAAWLVLSSSSLRHHHLNCMELHRLYT